MCGRRPRGVGRASRGRRAAVRACRRGNAVLLPLPLRRLSSRPRTGAAVPELPGPHLAKRDGTRLSEQTPPKLSAARRAGSVPRGLRGSAHAYRSWSALVLRRHPHRVTANPIPSGQRGHLRYRALQQDGEATRRHGERHRSYGPGFIQLDGPAGLLVGVFGLLRGRRLVPGSVRKEGPKIPPACVVLSDKITYTKWPTSRGDLGRSSTSRDATASHPRTLTRHGTIPNGRTWRSSYTRSTARTSGVSDARNSEIP